MNVFATETQPDDAGTTWRGFRLHRLDRAGTAAQAEARAFCLRVIAEVYGFAYRADWHTDLDSLLRADAANHNAPSNLGAFWLLRDVTGVPAATIGLKRLSWQPALATTLADRYADLATVPTLTRAYVRADLRGRGLGAALAGLAEAAARDFGDRVIYLHTNADAPAAQRFWHVQGWREFARFGISAHFDKVLGPVVTR